MYDNLNKPTKQQVIQCLKHIEKLTYVYNDIGGGGGFAGNYCCAKSDSITKNGGICTLPKGHSSRLHIATEEFGPEGRVLSWWY